MPPTPATLYVEAQVWAV